MKHKKIDMVLLQLPWGADRIKNGNGDWNVNCYWLCEVHFRNQYDGWEYNAVKEESDPMRD